MRDIGYFRFLQRKMIVVRMLLVLIIFLSCAVFFYDVCYASVERDPSITDEKLANLTVYITEYGSCYHTAVCGHLWSSKIPYNFIDAVMKGLQPCDDCECIRLSQKDAELIVEKYISGELTGETNSKYIQNKITEASAPIPKSTSSGSDTKIDQHQADHGGTYTRGPGYYGTRIQENADETRPIDEMTDLPEEEKHTFAFVVYVFSGCLLLWIICKLHAVYVVPAAQIRQEERKKKEEEAVREKYRQMYEGKDYHELAGVPDDVEINSGGTPIKGEVTEDRPYGDYTVYHAKDSKSKVVHRVCNCSKRTDLVPMHSFWAIYYNYRPCKHCYKEGEYVSTVPDWYKKYLDINEIKARYDIE